MKTSWTYLLLAVCLVAAMMAAGCSSSPSDEELKQLNDLKAQASTLEKQVADKTREKAALEKQLAEKNAKLQQCQADQEAVKKAMGGK
jgi:septal ring factor EnvC (AmiA/AmiB activator)